MNVEKLVLRIEGARPLLMHSSRLSDPLDAVTKNLARLTAKRPRTEADQEEIARVEWFGGLWLHGGAPCIIPEALEATFIAAAKTRRRGQQASAGMMIERPALLEYDGPKDPEALWLDEAYRLRVPVRIGNARTMRTRARFPQWAATFEVTYLKSMLNRDEVVETFAIAGFAKAIGDWRPRYGTFRVRQME